jgi:repressor of nif and glnA expression
MTIETKESKEQFRVTSEGLVDKVKELIHEGNVRRIIVKGEDGHTVLEIPVTVGVVGAIMAPALTGIAALGALAAEWTIEIERR